jgi:cobalt-zinc-cadmium efflux system membrane fusion protein
VEGFKADKNTIDGSIAFGAMGSYTPKMRLKLREQPHTKIMLVVLTLLLAACKSEAEREATRSLQMKNIPTPDGSIRLTASEVQANGLQTEAVIEQDLTLTLTAIGRVVARAGGESQVFSPFAGRLVADPARLPHIGSTVNKGQILAEVEQLVTASEQVQFAATEAQLQSAFEQAQQEVQLRQTELDRAKQLYQGGAIPLKQLQAAEFESKQAQARSDGARRAREQYEGILSQHTTEPRRSLIRAPISGTVVAFDLTPGQQTDSTRSLMTIVDLTSLWVEVPVHENDLSLIHRTKSVEFMMPASPGRTYLGKLITIGNLVDQANRTLTVVFLVNNPDGSLKLGMTTEARIPTGPRSRVLLIPTSALLFIEGQSSVYVEAQPGVYQRRVITTGQRSAEKIVVVHGLKAGEKVVTIGAGLLRSEGLKTQVPREAEVEKH